MRTAPPIAADDLEAQQAATIFGHAAHYFAEAADMIFKGAPYRDPEVQRMITAGRLKLAELPDRRH